MNDPRHNLYRAMQSRDRRFEGSFIAAITSTGIYCRPGCPAKMPREKNVRFFACAAAAEESGYRACLRCRPDASALLPAAAGSSATVARALQLFSQEHLGGIPTICDKLGVGERHLRRLFMQHLGTTPIAALRTQRLHFARTLLEQTRLPMSEVALAAGYRSTRRFNHEILRAFDRSPTRLRDGASRSLAPKTIAPGRTHGGSALIELKVPYAPPFDWPALLAFFGARAIEGVEVLDGETYRRSVRVGPPGAAAPIVLEVSHLPALNSLRGRFDVVPAQAILELVAGVKRMFGCAVQPHVVEEHLSRDRLLQRGLALHPGLRVPGAWDPFELSVRALLGQQISVRAAQTLAGRLVRAFGEPLPKALLRAAGPTHLFPTPHAIAKAGAARLAKQGVMPARAIALQKLGEAVASGALDFTKLRTLPAGEAVDAIDELPGFGPWSAHYIAMRALGEPDAFPLRDLGLLRGLRREQPDATFNDLRDRAETWRPFRATAAIALWLLDSHFANGDLE
jgi:AraC family transcriptional regulator of adaptative response / DNA-3-methyladenine glycosylase II